MNLCFFTTTKGHFGRKDIYKITVENLFSKVPYHYFFNRVAHIKVSPGEESVADEMEGYLTSRKFHVLKSLGEWQHHKMSHGYEYNKDIYAMFSNDIVGRDRFSLWLEDDWILNGEDVGYKLSEAQNFLKFDPNYLSVRVNAERYDDDKILDNGKFKVQKENYTNWGPTFTFQPTVVKTDSIHYAYTLLRRNWEQMKHLHVELQSTYCIRGLVANPTPFAMFDYDQLNCTHIGAPPFEEAI